MTFRHMITLKSIKLKCWWHSYWLLEVVAYFNNLVFQRWHKTYMCKPIDSQFRVNLTLFGTVLTNSSAYLTFCLVGLAIKCIALHQNHCHNQFGFNSIAFTFHVIILFNHHSCHHQHSHHQSNHPQPCHHQPCHHQPCHHQPCHHQPCNHQPIHLSISAIIVETIRFENISFFTNSLASIHHVTIRRTTITPCSLPASSKVCFCFTGDLCKEVDYISSNEDASRTMLCAGVDAVGLRCR